MRRIIGLAIANTMVQPFADANSSPTAQADAPPLLQFDQVGLAYPLAGTMRRIIEEVTLSVRSGEFISFVGPSGCGKTSLLRMVSGLDPAPIGEIRYRDQPIKRSLKNVGMAFQNPVLLPWRTALDNALLPLEIVQPYKSEFRQKRQQFVAMAQELLATVQLQDFQKQFPWQLSGGMRQRVSLCRALIHQPEILLLDEPFGALDAFTREEMWVMLQALWMRVQCVAILITHDLREAVFLSDKVYVMSPRPSSIIYEVAIDLPRPRTLDMELTEEFNHYFSNIRRHIRHD
jgi:NitT/TauT family transport system ATP-binding protein